MNHLVFFSNFKAFWLVCSVLFVLKCVLPMVLKSKNKHLTGTRLMTIYISKIHFQNSNVKSLTVVFIIKVDNHLFYWFDVIDLNCNLFNPLDTEVSIFKEELWNSIHLIKSPFLTFHSGWWINFARIVTHGFHDGERKSLPNKSLEVTEDYFSQVVAYYWFGIISILFI